MSHFSLFARIRTRLYSLLLTTLVLGLFFIRVPLVELQSMFGDLRLSRRDGIAVLCCSTTFFPEFLNILKVFGRLQRLKAISLHNVSHHILFWNFLFLI